MTTADNGCSIGRLDRRLNSNVPETFAWMKDDINIQHLQGNNSLIRNLNGWKGMMARVEGNNGMGNYPWGNNKHKTQHFIQNAMQLDHGIHFIMHWAESTFHFNNTNGKRRKEEHKKSATAALILILLYITGNYTHNYP